jgi:hypothetical protein
MCSAQMHRCAVQKAWVCSVLGEESLKYSLFCYSGKDIVCPHVCWFFLFCALVVMYFQGHQCVDLSGAVDFREDRSMDLMLTTPHLAWQCLERV